MDAISNAELILKRIDERYKDVPEKAGWLDSMHSGQIQCIGQGGMRDVYRYVCTRGLKE